MTAHAPTFSADVMVVGAGPAGLFQVFELGLQGLTTLGVDALPRLGGQCSTLYADKPIYDIPGVPRCTGQELVDRLNEQIRPFATPWLLSQQLVGFEADNHGLTVHLSAGQSHRVKALVLAAGVGAFAHRRLAQPALDPCRGVSVLDPDTLATRPPQALQNQRVVVAGSDDVAIDTALQALASGAGHVALLHRRAALDASDEALLRWAQAEVSGRASRLTGQITGAQAQGAQLTGLVISRAGEADATTPADVLVEALGLLPQLGPFADWGLALHKKQVSVNPATLQTSVPRVYAVGDVAHYPGKRKLIVSAFHEATLAAYAIAETLQGGPVPFEYTTASARLHARLGLTD